MPSSVFSAAAPAAACPAAPPPAAPDAPSVALRWESSVARSVVDPGPLVLRITRKKLLQRRRQKESKTARQQESEERSVMHGGSPE